MTIMFVMICKPLNSQRNYFYHIRPETQMNNPELQFSLSSECDKMNIPGKCKQKIGSKISFSNSGHTSF